jgi:hypothetical protein
MNQVRNGPEHSALPQQPKIRVSEVQTVRSREPGGLKVRPVNQIRTKESGTVERVLTLAFQQKGKQT